MNWRSSRSRAAGYQLLFAIVLAIAGWRIAANVDANLARAGIGLDFGLFVRPAGFDISLSWIDFDSSDSYALAFVVGLVNTLVLAALALVTATLVGIAAGLAQVSGNPLAERVTRGYVELMRNLPKLVILLAVFIAMLNGLPNVRASLNPLPGVYLSNRGLFLPAPVWTSAQWTWLASVVAAAAGAWWVARRARLTRESTGVQRPVARVGVALVAAGALLPGLWGAWPGWTLPERAGFGFDGGTMVSVQFVALWFALTLYHGAQIGEVVRGGIEAVPRGQSEAAAALGLPTSLRLRLVILPQVLRTTIPPMTSLYLNLLKNTSIGLAVGYTDLLAVAGTTINQSFHPVEVMTVVMTVYLAIGLLLSGAMNLLNARLRIAER